MAAKTWSALVDGNWSLGANWNGASVPATTDTVTFNGTSTKNCTVDALGTWSGGTLTITSAYTGTITQNVAITTAAFSIAAGTWTQAATFSTGTSGFTVSGGTWTGAIQTMTTGAVTFSGGTLTATSGTWNVGGSMTKTNSPTFNHNSGTVNFNTGTTATIDMNGLTFNAVTINKTSSATFTISSGTTLPLGNSPSTTTGSGGTTNNNGTLTVGTGTWTHTGVFNNNATGIVSGSITTFLCSGNSCTLASGSQFPGTVTAATFGEGLTISTTNTAAWPANVAVTFSTGATNGKSVDANGVTFGTCTMSKGAVTFTVASGTTIPLGASPTINTTSTTLTVNGTLSGSGTLTFSGASTVSSTGVISGFSTIQLSSGVVESITINASATIPASLNVVINNSGSSGAKTFAGGGKTYGNFTRSGSGTGTLTITGSNTWSDFKDNDNLSAHTILFTSGTTQTVTTFTVRGASGKVITLNAVTSGSAFTLHTTGSNIICADYLSLKDSTVDASPVWYAGPLTHSTNTSGNTNWVFTACAYVLSASPGSYTMTGSSASVLTTRLLKASPGSYTVSGASAQVLRTRILNASPGAYTLTGASALLLRGKVLNASPGSYSLSGASSALLASRLLKLSAGSYNLTGDSAALLVARLLKLSAGSYSLTGNATSLLAAKILKAAAGSYALTGDAAALLAKLVLNGAPGSYSIIGISADLSRGGVPKSKGGSGAIGRELQRVVIDNSRARQQAEDKAKLSREQEELDLSFLIDEYES